ncbi:MAG TPA: hypothetical protein DCP90_01910 [Clostridiales bacterium]|nr:MAG: hypothetical protein A2Y22_08745 [Clostridiales bacterium GWD2_32_59]HAN09348.1 hypothetical protein [Clostridiales bacterium]
MSEVIISLKPKYAKMIKDGKKNHEFRSRIPKDIPSLLLTYVTVPVAKLMYLFEVETPVVYPNKIEENGIGNVEFNKGERKGKYAYPILHMFELVEPIPLERLKTEFGFTPPQSFAYSKKYEELMNYLNKNGKMIKIF